MLDVAVGITFSRGLIDFTFFGLLQGTEKTDYQWILILGPIYSLVYYFIFSFMIRKFNYSTPGRNDADNKLQTRDSYKKNKSSELIDDIVKELGGINNIESLDACITRLRVTVKDTDIVASDEVWRSLQAKGVIRSGNGVQIIYGTQAEIYKNQILDKYNL